MITWVVLGIVVLVAVVAIGTYNGLITLKNRVEEAASDIDVQLKRRYELIPNLVNTVKGYAKHEQAAIDKVTKAREGMTKGSTADKIAASNQVTEALKSIFAIAEDNQELKANENFMQLQTDLTDTQDKIMSAQRFYNGNVRDFNTKLQVFPTNLYGQSLGFKPYEFIEAAEGEKANVEVNF